MTKSISTERKKQTKWTTLKLKVGAINNAIKKVKRQPEEWGKYLETIE